MDESPFNIQGKRGLWPERIKLIDQIPETISGSLRQKLMASEEDEPIDVKITLHAKDWIKLGKIMEYRTRFKNDRRFRTISGALWMLIDKSFVGMENALKRLEAKEEEPPTQQVEDDDDDDQDENDQEIEKEDSGSTGFHVLRPKKI